MDNIKMEESTSLRTELRKDPQHQQFYRERRIKLINLNIIYYITWILLIIISILIMPYLLLLFPQNVSKQCLNYRQKQITTSLTLAIMTTILTTILFLIQLMTISIKMTIFRRNFSRIAFILLTSIAIINFCIAIYFFNLYSCYFEAIIDDDDDDYYYYDYDWFTDIIKRYDIKIAAIMHLLCSILSFFTGIGFAIIRHNFKYVMRIDFY